MIKTEQDFLDKYDPSKKILFPDGSIHNGKDLNKEWVDKEKLSNKLEWVTYALEYNMFDEKKPVEYLMKVIDDAKKLLDDLNKELMKND